MRDKFECFNTPEGQTLVTAIQKASNIVLTTHLGPDVDGLACEVAMYEGLRAMGKQVTVLNSADYARSYSYIDPQGIIHTYEAGRQGDLEDADLVLCVDVSEPSRIGQVYEKAKLAGKRILALDHHPRTPRSTDGLLVPEFSSASEMVFGLFRLLNVEITKTMAFTIYCGIIYDTQLFRYIKNDPQTFVVAAQLLQAGADAQRAQELMYGSRPVDRLRLLSRVVDRMHIEKGGRLAWSFVDNQALKGLNLDSDDLRSMVTELLSLNGVMLAAFFRPGKPGQTKISLRSKPPVRVDLVASQFNGGGHQQASGCVVDEPMQDALKRVLPALRTLF